MNFGCKVAANIRDGYRGTSTQEGVGQPICLMRRIGDSAWSAKGEMVMWLNTTKISSNFQFFAVEVRGSFGH